MKLANLISPFRESWGRVMQDNSDGLRNSRRGILSTNLFSSIHSSLTSGIFFTALLLIVLKDATTEEYGYFIALNTSIQSLAGSAQIISPFFVEHMRSRRRLIYILYGISHAINIVMLPLLMYLPFTVSLKGYLFVVLCGIMNVSTALCGPTLSIWTLHSLPDTCRSDYFMLNSSITSVLNAVLSFLLSVFMDAHTASGTQLTAIIIMRCLAVPFIAGEFAARHYTVEPEYNTAGSRVNFLNILRAPFTSLKFLSAVLILFLWNFFGGFAGTYYYPYLLDGANLSYTFYSLCTIPGLPLSILLMPVWNKLIHRYGWLRIMALSMSLYVFCYGCNGLVTESTQWMYMVSVIICNVIGGGVMLGFNNLSYMFLPDTLRSSCLAFYSLVGSLATALSAVAARWFFDLTSGYTINVFGLVLENRAYMAFVTLFAVIPIALFVWFLAHKYEKKPARESEPTPAE